MVFYFYLKISSWLGSQMIARFPSFGFLLYINLHSSLGLLPKGHLRSGLPGSNGVRVLKIDLGSKTVLAPLSPRPKRPKTAGRQGFISIHSPPCLHPRPIALTPFKGVMEAWRGERLKQALE